MSARRADGGACSPDGEAFPEGNKVSARRADGVIYFLPFDFVKREKVTKRENRPGEGFRSSLPWTPPFKNDQLGGLRAPYWRNPRGVPRGFSGRMGYCCHGAVCRALGTELAGDEGGFRRRHPSPSFEEVGQRGRFFCTTSAHTGVTKEPSPCNTGFSQTSQALTRRYRGTVLLSHLR